MTRPENRTGVPDPRVPDPRAPSPAETVLCATSASGLSFALEEMLFRGLRLSLQDLAPDATPVDAGLTSYDLVEISAELARREGITVTPDQLAAAATLADLDALIARHDTTAPAVFGSRGLTGAAGAPGAGGQERVSRPSGPPDPRPENL